MDRSSEIEREKDMKQAGLDRFRNSWKKAQESGNLVDHPATNKSIEVYLFDFANAVDAWKTKCEAGGPGRRMSAYQILKEVDSGMLAYLTARQVMASVLEQSSHTDAMLKLGRTIEGEVILELFSRENKGAYTWVDGQIKKRKIKRRHQKQYFFERTAQYKGVVLPKFTKTQAIHVGDALISLFIESTNLCKVSKRRARNGNLERVLVGHRSLEETVLGMGEDELSIARPVYGPMLVKPDEWSEEQRGGYLWKEFKDRLDLVKSANVTERLDRVRKRMYKSADLSEVHSAINALNQTPYRINTVVLDTMAALWSLDKPVAGLPSRDRLDPPPFPPEADTDPILKKGWKLKAREIHEENENNLSKRIDIDICLGLARELNGAFYFPHQCDFRGRFYPIPTSLHIQGPDYSRGLLEFAEGKPAKGKALDWLCIHGANMFGFDKAVLAERVAWVKERHDAILAVASDPLEHKWWQDASKPFQFLAWAVDYKRVSDGGLSHCRVGMDGSCNGLQHLSAMLLDPIGAGAVNLAANDCQADIYQEVADVVVKKLKAAKGKEKTWSDVFVHLVDRSLCKRAVMVMPYGGKPRSTEDYVQKELKEKLKGEKPFGDEQLQAERFLSKLVYDSTREVITGGARVMDWFQTCCRIAAKEKKHLSWTAPSGFPILQTYCKREEVSVKTKLNGSSKIRKTVLREAVDEIDPVRSTNGISPNIVHSFDAAALVKTINAAKAKGVSAFQFIHDDYGTHAADTEELAVVLREVFVEIYRNDVLEDLRRQWQEQVKAPLPQPPERLGFEIDQVLESTYFFA